MYNRYLDIDFGDNCSVFLFGARQTGKSTYLRTRFPEAMYIDLLDTNLSSRYRRKPSLLYSQLAGNTEKPLVIIDEIAEVPELLNEVHRLISEYGFQFILCGSSARKLKRKSIPDFDIDRAVRGGMLPTHYLSDNPSIRLAAYVEVYLKEEIKAEALVRNLSTFQRFLEVAALSDGEMLNYNNVASDCGVSATTVKEYFSILEDSLIGYFIPAYRHEKKRRLVQAPRFYYFDVGIANHLLHRKDLQRGTVEYGHAFEHFVMQELKAYIGYTHNEQELSYWRTYSGIEVDAVIGDAKIAIEIKSSEEVLPKHLKGLKAFGEEHPHCRLIIVSLDPINRKIGDIETIYIYDFLQQLWAGKLF